VGTISEIIGHLRRAELPLYLPVPQDSEPSASKSVFSSIKSEIKCISDCSPHLVHEIYGVDGLLLPSPSERPTGLDLGSPSSLDCSPDRAMANTD